MKNYLLILSCFIAENISFAQNGFPKYYEFISLNKKADSLYKSKDFANAAYFYSAAAKVNVEKAIPIDFSSIRYSAACSWALANYSDSAFLNLEFIATKMNYTNYKNLIKDPDLNSLHNDKRWKYILGLVKSNEEQKERKEKNYTERTTFKGNSKEIIFFPTQNI